MQWLFERTTGFPKSRRHTLTNRLESALLDFQRAIALANRRRGPARVRSLDEADGLLDGSRFLVRFATDLGYLSGRQYEFAAEKLAEIGRLLGAWRKVTLQQR
ncbi:MAG: four helix bundle protein [Planctomycetota bacterium]|nr:four helix bundle protein [Planctomycetota bacterium]